MQRDPLDAIAGIRILRLQAVVQGIVIGIMLGFAIFLATISLVVRGGPVVGPHLALLAQFCPGYRVTFGGSLIGFGWGFVYGFAAGYLVSVLYNVIVGLRGRSHG
jgi:hypothetical protein